MLAYRAAVRLELILTISQERIKTEFAAFIENDHRDQFLSIDISEVVIMESAKVPLLLCPGLAALPSKVRIAMSRQVVDARSPAFGEIYNNCVSQLQYILHTTQDVLLLPGNGTLAMEASVVNMLSPGDKVVVAINGEFGERFAALCLTYGATVISVRSSWDQPIPIDKVVATIERQPDVRALFVVAVESSTGVVNNISELARKARAIAPAMIIVVDAVSSLGAHDIRPEYWDIDVVCSASHKALAGPPGIAILCLSDRGWAKAAEVTQSRFSLDLNEIRKCHRRGQTRFTPPVNAFIGLDAALCLIAEQGLPEFMAHQQQIARYTRAALRTEGLRTVVPEVYAAHTISAAWLPSSMSAGSLVTNLREEYAVVIGVGRGLWQDQMIRIGHKGHTRLSDVRRAMAALHDCLVTYSSKTRDAC